MRDLADFILAYGSRLFGGLLVLLCFFYLNWKGTSELPVKSPLLLGIVCLLMGFLIEYMSFPVTLSYRKLTPVIDFLTFKTIAISSDFIALSYAFLIFAIQRALWKIGSDTQ